MPIRSFVVLISSFVIAACGASEEIPLATAEDRFRAAMKAYHEEEYLDAIQHFDIIRLQYPGSSIADSARYFAGLSRMKREEYLFASYEFNQLISSYPKSRLLGDAQYMFADCYYALSPKVSLDQTSTQRAIDALQTAIEYYPSHPRAQEAERKILELYGKLAEKEYTTGVLYTKMENDRSAMIYFDNVIDKYYNTEYVDDAMAAKIRILMKRKRYTLAMESITIFLQKYPDSPYRSEIADYQKTISTQDKPSEPRESDRQ